MGPGARSKPAPRDSSRLDVVVTADGSKTLFDRDRGVHYRSTFGARTESRHVFIEGTGLTNRAGPWSVLEFGFGGGTNFRETVKAGGDREIHYVAIDAAPIPPGSIAELEPGFALESCLFDATTQGRGEAHLASTHLELFNIDFADFRHPARFDAVFLDPFGPKENPDGWTVAVMKNARQHLKPDGLLATYSAARAVRKNLVAAGFEVASLPGVGPKRDITIAAIDEGRLPGRVVTGRYR